MAEIKDKVITVESLAALHNYDENTYLKMSGGTVTGDITLSGGGDIVSSNKDFYLSHSSGDTSHRSVILGGDSYESGASIYLNGKDYSSDKGSFLLRASNGTDSVNLVGLPDGTLTWNGKNVAVSGDYLPITGGTLSGNVAITKGSPTIMLKVSDTSLETRLYKNASTTADYGTMLADYDTNGKRDALTLRRSANLDEKLSISVNNASGGNDIYYVYGEHNKPLPSDIGAFSSNGGTINGDTNVAGVLKVRNKQAFHYDTSSNAQTIGTNDATGGTIICCGSSAYLTVNGARLLTSAIVPRDGLTTAPNIGYADGRYNCIYLKTAANVSSDERLKRDIVNLDNQALADFVDNLNVISYNYNDDEENAGSRIGLTAQNVLQANEDIAKFFVEQDDNGYYSLRPSDLVFPLIAAVQKLKKEVEELKAKLD